MHRQEEKVGDRGRKKEEKGRKKWKEREKERKKEGKKEKRNKRKTERERKRERKEKRKRENKGARDSGKQKNPFFLLRRRQTLFLCLFSLLYLFPFLLL